LLATSFCHSDLASKEFLLGQFEPMHQKLITFTLARVLRQVIPLDVLSK